MVTYEFFIVLEQNEDEEMCCKLEIQTAERSFKKFLTDSYQLIRNELKQKGLENKRIKTYSIKLVPTM